MERVSECDPVLSRALKFGGADRPHQIFMSKSICLNMASADLVVVCVLRRARWARLLEEDDDFRRWFENLERGSRVTALENARVLFSSFDAFICDFSKIKTNLKLSVFQIKYIKYAKV